MYLRFNRCFFKVILRNLCITIFSVCTALPVLADLGDADLGKVSKTFDAWCSYPKNNCTVTFSDGNNRISVNNGKGIHKNQITMLVIRAIMTPNAMGDLYWNINYEIRYRDESTGESRDALIIFANTKTANEFDNYFFRLSNRPVIRVSDLLWTDKPELFAAERGGEIKEYLESQRIGVDALNGLGTQLMMQNLIQQQNKVPTAPTQQTIKVAPRNCVITGTPALAQASVNCQ